jgi:hypothetical protein
MAASSEIYELEKEVREIKELLLIKQMKLADLHKTSDSIPEPAKEEPVHIDATAFQKCDTLTSIVLPKEEYLSGLDKVAFVYLAESNGDWVKPAWTNLIAQTCQFCDNPIPEKDQGSYMTERPSDSYQPCKSKACMLLMRFYRLKADLRDSMMPFKCGSWWSPFYPTRDQLTVKIKFCRKGKICDGEIFKMDYYHVFPYDNSDGESRMLVTVFFNDMASYKSIPLSNIIFHSQSVSPEDIVTKTHVAANGDVEEYSKTVTGFFDKSFLMSEDYIGTNVDTILDIEDKDYHDLPKHFLKIREDAIGKLSNYRSRILAEYERAEKAKSGSDADRLAWDWDNDSKKEFHRR